MDPHLCILGHASRAFRTYFGMMGPTTLSDHLSVIHTYECQFNSSLRVIWPIPHAIGVPRSILGLNPSIVEGLQEAERRDINGV